MHTFFSKDVGVTSVLFSAEEKFLAAALRYCIFISVPRLHVNVQSRIFISIDY